MNTMDGCRQGNGSVKFTLQLGVTPHELRPDLYPDPTDGLSVGCKANTQDEPELIHENQA
ncbi:antirepressor protein Cro [Escherichia coli]|uniref:Antirepressor protein Cro n=1 Tax=Escherichia coli TaxID=562 RepID=A0A376KVS6_ECOLX|nr:antirepressor protein Cro [Escherichia coli]